MGWFNKKPKRKYTLHLISTDRGEHSVMIRAEDSEWQWDFKTNEFSIATSFRESPIEKTESFWTYDLDKATEVRDKYASRINALIQVGR